MMKAKWVIVLTMLTIFFLFATEGWTLCNKRALLFRIERSKNKNIVQYDACLLRNNNIFESSPVQAYWVLADGKKEELSLLESKQAYGIESKEKLGENKFRIVLVALKDRDIIVEKIKDKYKALVKINGESSILERVYVQSEEQTLGLPKVHYVDVFGRNLRTNKPVKERITPS
jgi:hypothetical protein